MLRTARTSQTNLVLALFFVLSLFLSLPGGSGLLQAQNVSFGLSLSDGKVKSFYLAVSSHFGVPEATVVQFRERYRLPETELPVVFFLAREARVEPAVVVNLRLKGMSWWDISLHFRLSPEIFFLPVTVVKTGPPYGRAYGYYRQYRERKAWGRVVLTDAEIIDLVNLKFVSAHHNIPPEKIMEMRARGQNFLDINDAVIKEKAKGKTAEHPPKDKPGKKKGGK